jgi:hypothetical protein
MIWIEATSKERGVIELELTVLNMMDDFIGMEPMLRC